MKLKWKISPTPNNEEGEDYEEVEEDFLLYRPRIDALKDFKIRYADGTPPILNLNNDDDSVDLTYHAEDSTYRYILRDGFNGWLDWRYTYRGETFGEECKVSEDAVGTRYVQHTAAYMGATVSDKAERFDYYCRRDTNNTNYGYVLPWDAEECFVEHNIIGIVLYVGHNSTDKSDYSNSGIGEEKCHGYAVALTDVIGDESGKCKWAENGKDAAKKNVTDNKSNAMYDWGGYYNLIKMKESINFGESKIIDGSIFPAAYACETYVGLSGNLAAPGNSSGWFLPAYAMIEYALSVRDEMNKSFNAIAKQIGDDGSYGKMFLGPENGSSAADSYWTSNESPIATQAYVKKITEAGSTLVDKTSLYYVRPVLAF